MIQKYLQKIKKSLDEISTKDMEKMIKMLYEAYEDGRQIFIIGNGGSAATASHLAADLNKNTAAPKKTRFRTICLNDNIASLTAYANDCGYDQVFKEQLVNLLNPGDLVIAITASGNSSNILQAIKYAQKKKAKTLGIIGFGGGRLKKIVDCQVTLASKNYGQVEGVHSVICHLIVEYFKEKITKKAGQKA